MHMLNKLTSLFLTLWVVITLTFVLMKLIPGDPFTDEQALPIKTYSALKIHYGLDQPIYSQYFQYLKSILKLDFGPSFKYKDRTVTQIIKDSFPISLILGIQTLIFSLSFGLLFGSLAVFYQNKWQDGCVILFTTLLISIPSFVLAALLQYQFAVKLGWLPIARWGSFAQTILPVLSLAALPTAYITRLTRANLIGIINEKYVVVARAKGLSKSVVMFKHALRNAICPIFSYLGILATNIFVGSFVIEKIFGIPGLGRWFVLSIMDRDYPVIMGLTIFYSIILLTLTTLVDICYGFIDPRIKLNEAKPCVF